jgi:hypothetical protein
MVLLEDDGDAAGGARAAASAGAQLRQHLAAQPDIAQRRA